jgi:hypothetical protein
VSRRLVESLGGSQVIPRLAAVWRFTTVVFATPFATLVLKVCTQSSSKHSTALSGSCSIMEKSARGFCTAPKAIDDLLNTASPELAAAQIIGDIETGLIGLLDKLISVRQSEHFTSTATRRCEVQRNVRYR